MFQAQTGFNPPVSKKRTGHTGQLLAAGRKQQNRAERKRALEAKAIADGVSVAEIRSR